MACENFKFTSDADIQSYEIEVEWKIHKEILKVLKISKGDHISPCSNQSHLIPNGILN